jgi:hypothetical protein
MLGIGQCGSASSGGDGSPGCGDGNERSLSPGASDLRFAAALRYRSLKYSSVHTGVQPI